MSLIDPTSLSSSSQLARSFAASSNPFERVRDAARDNSLAAPYSQTSMLAMLLAIDAIAAFDIAAVSLTELASTADHIELTAVCVAAFGVVATILMGGFSRSILFSPGRQAWAAFLGGMLSVVFATAALGLAGADQGNIIAIAIALAPVAPGKALFRFLTARTLVNDPDRRLAPRAVILGGGEHAAMLIAALHDDLPRLRLLGIVDDAEVGAPLPTPWSAAPHAAGALRYLGLVETVFDLIRAGHVDEVIVAMPSGADRRVLSLVRRLRDYPVHVRLAPGAIAFQLPGSEYKRLGNVDLLHAAKRPMQGWRNVAKRLADIAISGLAIGVLAIPMLVIAAAIRLDSPGPALFRQRRTGFNDSSFYILKFRTMAEGPLETGGIVQAKRHDARITRVGRILRRTSLDEIPQFLNVLRGDMSVIGPRPHVPEAPFGQPSYDGTVSRYSARHRVLPGMTGLAQVRGFRGETDTKDALVRRVESDLEYIETWTFRRDLAILWRTIGTVLSMRNAR